MNKPNEEEVLFAETRIKELIQEKLSSELILGGASKRARHSKRKVYVDLIKRDRELEEILISLKKEGLSLRVIAGRLNELGIKTPRGCKHSATSVKRILDRLEL